MGQTQLPDLPGWDSEATICPDSRERIQEPSLNWKRNIREFGGVLKPQWGVRI